VGGVGGGWRIWGGGCEGVEGGEGMRGGYGWVGMAVGGRGGVWKE